MSSVEVEVEALEGTEVALRRVEGDMAESRMISTL